MAKSKNPPADNGSTKEEPAPTSSSSSRAVTGLLLLCLAALVGLVVYKAMTDPPESQSASNGSERELARMRAVDQAEARDDLPGAIALLQAHLQESPEDIEARRRLSTLCLRYGASEGVASAIEVAAEQAEAILQVRPGDRWGHWLLGESMFRLGRIGYAVHWAEAEGTDDPDLLILIGRSYLQAGMMDRAFSPLRQGLRQRPNSIEALTAMAEFALRQRDFESALVMLNRAATLRPNSVALQVRLASVEVQTGLVEQAERRLEALRDHPLGILALSELRMVQALRLPLQSMERGQRLQEAGARARSVRQQFPAFELEAVILEARSELLMGGPEHLAAAEDLIAQARQVGPEDPRVAELERVHRQIRAGTVQPARPMPTDPSGGASIFDLPQSGTDPSGSQPPLPEDDWFRLGN